MNKIPDRVIELVQKENLDDSYWLGELGFANSKLKNESLEENDFLYSFYEQGQLLWDKYKEDIRSLICDTENGIPKPFINELIGGDIRNILETLATMIVASVKVEYLIAIPLSCLLLKYKISNFCSIK